MNENDNKIFYSLFFAKKYDEAEKCLENFSNQYPTDYNVFYCYGMLYQELGNFEKAKENFKKCLLLRPEFSPAGYLISEIFFIEKDYDSAISFLNIAVLNHRLFYKAYNLLGLCYSRKGNIKSALDNYLYAHGTFLKDILMKYIRSPETPDKRNFSFTDKVSSFWKLVSMGHMKSMASAAGITDLKTPSQEMINKCLDGSDLRMTLWNKNENLTEMNFNIFGVIYGKLINDSFYSTVCYNIGGCLIDLKDFKEAKKWLLESLELTPSNKSKDPVIKTLNYLESLENTDSSNISKEE